MTVVAGPGFGKTSLLGAATSPGRRPPDGRDVWLTCEPSDAVGAALLDGLAAAMDLSAPTIDEVLRAVWHAAPTQVCFVFDDVHELEERSEGAQLVGRLVAELPRNGHVVMSSRSAPPVPTAAIAASGRLERIVEDDLLFTTEELHHFAEIRGVDPARLAATGGWPALVQLVASAGDLVEEYLWDVVLARLGERRTQALTLLEAVGGADDEVAQEVLGAESTLREIMGGVPLVSWMSHGTDRAWATVHPLWEPVLRRRRPDVDVVGAQRTAAVVHRRRGRFDSAIDLFACAGAWEEVLATILEAARHHGAFDEWHRFARWRSVLDDDLQDHPVARLAAGIEVASRIPVDALSAFGRAADGFRELGDVDGELAALAKLGLVAWWANDVAALFDAIGRASELASDGHAEAQVAVWIGEAAIAHASGDHHRVLEVLGPVDLTGAGEWAAGAGWLRAVAHRRLGDLERAQQALDATSELVPDDVQIVIARARTHWLRGNIEHVPETMRRAAVHYDGVQHRYLSAEATLELAARLAWLGDRKEARRLIDEIGGDLPSIPGALATVLWTLANAALAVDVGDEHAAAALLAAEPLARPGTPHSWYWVDRAALALLHVSCPDDRAAWSLEAVAPVHRIGLELAEALQAARDGELATVAQLVWPTTGRVRAHLPVAWISELATAGFESDNPPPSDLVDHLVAAGRSPLPKAGPAAAHRSDPVLDVLASGPVRLLRDGADVDHDDLRRRRVRELLAVLVAGRVHRRDEIAELMFPDTADPRHNLRVTLGYLQRVIGDHPALIADQSRIRLLPSPWLRCDLWELEDLLAAADAAERDADPGRALERYAALLPLWRGDPFADLADVDWVRDEQTRRRSRFVAAAVRAAELHLAAGSFRAAAEAATRGIEADQFDERAHRVVISALVGDGDVARARVAADRCLAALSELGVRPSPDTSTLIGSIERLR